MKEKNPQKIASTIEVNNILEIMRENSFPN
jgi:hypothetical protein